MAKKEILESAFKEKVYDDLDSLGDICWYEKIQQVGIKGTPDILVCINGFFVALELKRNSTSSNPLQEYKLGKIRKAGGIGVRVFPENWNEVFKSLKKIAKNRRA